MLFDLWTHIKLNHSNSKHNMLNKSPHFLRDRLTFPSSEYYFCCSFFFASRIHISIFYTLSSIMATLLRDLWTLSGEYTRWTEKKDHKKCWKQLSICTSRTLYCKTVAWYFCFTYSTRWLWIMSLQHCYFSMVIYSENMSFIVSEMAIFHGL